MPASVVFNPNTGWSTALGFNPNPSYGGPEADGDNYQTQRPRFGTWAGRNTGNIGKSWEMTFVEVPVQQLRYIRSFHRQYQNGFFTYIDYDDNGREYVGRFTSAPKFTHTANLKYNVSVMFEEIPGAPMRNYPSNWATSSHYLYVVDDFLNTAVATSGAAWNAQQTPAAVAAGLSTADPSTYEMYEASASSAVGDFAQIEYMGYGFTMLFRQDASFSPNVNILLDDVTIITGLSLVNGTSTAVAGPVITLPAAPGGGNDTVITMQNVPLGRHRVKLVNAGTGALIYPALQVMH